MSKLTTFIAAAGFALLAGGAQAAPVAAPLDQTSPIASDSPVASDIRPDCRANMHLDAANRCVPNHRRPMTRRLICPRGTHLAPSGRRCLSNRL